MAALRLFQLKQLGHLLHGASAGLGVGFVMGLADADADVLGTRRLSASPKW